MLGGNVTTQLLTSAQFAIQERLAAAREDRGAAMAEYGMMLALIALVAIGALTIWGQSVLSLFQLTEEQFDESKPDLLK